MPCRLLAVALCSSLLLSAALCCPLVFCRSLLRIVALCCSLLLYVALCFLCCSLLPSGSLLLSVALRLVVAICCPMLLPVALCCSLWRRLARSRGRPQGIFRMYGLRASSSYCIPGTAFIGLPRRKLPMYCCPPPVVGRCSFGCWRLAFGFGLLGLCCWAFGFAVVDFVLLGFVLSVCGFWL